MPHTLYLISLSHSCDDDVCIERIFYVTICHLPSMEWNEWEEDEPTTICDDVNRISFEKEKSSLVFIGQLCWNLLLWMYLLMIWDALNRRQNIRWLLAVIWVRSFFDIRFLCVIYWLMSLLITLRGMTRQINAIHITKRTIHPIWNRDTTKTNVLLLISWQFSKNIRLFYNK